MSKDYNLFEAWKDYFYQTSNFFDTKASEDFPSQSMSQILEFSLQVKKFLNEMTERYFEQVNIPTRTDIANVSSLIVNVDAKVDEVEEIVEELKENQASQTREIANLKKEIKNLDSKLNQILNLLKAPKEQAAGKSAAKQQ